MEPTIDQLPAEIRQVRIQLNRLETLLSEISKSKETQITWLSVPEVANYLNLSIPSIYRLTSNRKIPHVRKGKKLRFLKSAIDIWLSEGRRQTVDEI